MLQYIIICDNAHNAADVALDVLERGCKWIRLDVSQLESNEAEKWIKDIQELCKQHECMLSIENDVVAAKQWQLDGAHITSQSTISPVEARKLLGEEPILGMTINDAAQVPFLPRTAVDYIEVDAVKDINDYSEVVKQMKLTGLEEPVVARLSDISMLNEIMATGINGIALYHSPTNILELQDIITFLNSLLQTRLKSFE